MPQPPPTLLQCPVRQFNPQEMQLFMQLSLLSSREPAIFARLEADSRASSPIYNVLESRLKAGKRQVHVLLLLWLAALANGNPSRAALWAWTCCHMPVSGAPGDILVWANSFPLGVPTDAAYETVWEAQKGDGPLGNLLDRPDVWATVRDDVPTPDGNDATPP